MTMVGMDKNTGKLIGGIDHLEQSVRDILTTPQGSRVMRRAYGGGLYDSVDFSITPTQYLRIYQAIAESITRYEKRITLTRIYIQDSTDGRLTVFIYGTYEDTEISFGSIQVAPEVDRYITITSTVNDVQAIFLGSTYSLQLAAQSNSNDPIRWRVRNRFELPPGISINESTGLISGVANELRSLYNVPIEAYNDVGADSIVLTFRVHDVASPPVITSVVSDQVITVLDSYMLQLVTTGDPTPVWSVIGGVTPAGLSLSGDGLISGIPTDIQAPMDMEIEARNSEGVDTITISFEVLPIAARWEIIPDASGAIGFVVEVDISSYFFQGVPTTTIFSVDLYEDQLATTPLATTHALYNTATIDDSTLIVEFDLTGVSITSFEDIYVTATAHQP